MSRAIVRETKSLRSLDTGKDLVLVATHQRDVEAANVATDDKVCIDDFVGLWCGCFI